MKCSTGSIGTLRDEGRAPTLGVENARQTKGDGDSKQPTLPMTLNTLIVNAAELNPSSAGMVTTTENDSR